MIAIYITLAAIIVFALWFYLSLKRNKRNHAKEEAKIELRNKLSYFIHQVEIAETLRDVYITHIRLWANGIHHVNFGPDPYGMFRTDDILMMTPEEVYLGNVWGLFTKQLTYWETCSDNDVVLKQYKHVLISNMEQMKKSLE